MRLGGHNRRTDSPILLCVPAEVFQAESRSGYLHRHLHNCATAVMTSPARFFDNTRVTRLLPGYRHGSFSQA